MKNSTFIVRNWGVSRHARMPFKYALPPRYASTRRWGRGRGSTTARRGRVSRSPHDIAVENGGAEVGREQLEVGESAELRGKVCQVAARRI